MVACTATHAGDCRYDRPKPGISTRRTVESAAVANYVRGLCLCSIHRLQCGIVFSDSGATVALVDVSVIPEEPVSVFVVAEDVVGPVLDVVVSAEHIRVLNRDSTVALVLSCDID